MDPPTHPNRRIDDCISYKDMVEYVTKEQEQYHMIRAETLIMIGRDLEKMEKAVADHESWHRDVLQDYLNRATSNRTAIVAVSIAAVSCLISAFGTLAVLHG